MVSARATPMILALDLMRTMAETKKYIAIIDPAAFLGVTQIRLIKKSMDKRVLY